MLFPIVSEGQSEKISGERESENRYRDIHSIQIASEDIPNNFLGIEQRGELVSPPMKINVIGLRVR